MADVPATATQKPCVYCLGTRTLRDHQILVRGTRFYLCAPRGQLVEGYLAIAPFDCIPSLSLLPPDHLDELAELRSLVGAFYADVYDVADPVFYEQGRGGGGASVDEDGLFPLHAHLCSLPLRLDLHAHLAGDLVSIAVAGLQDISAAAANRPYLYLECRDGHSYSRSVYVPRSAAGYHELERSRFKPLLAGVAGLTARGDWRTHPGDAELDTLIDRFRRWRRTSIPVREA